MTSKVDPNVSEPLVRMAISALVNASDRMSNIQAGKDGDHLFSAEHHIAEAIGYLQAWATANGIELRTTMKT